MTDLDKGLSPETIRKLKGLKVGMPSLPDFFELFELLPACSLTKRINLLGPAIFEAEADKVLVAHHSPREALALLLIRLCKDNGYKIH